MQDPKTPGGWTPARKAFWIALGVAVLLIWAYAYAPVLTAPSRGDLLQDWASARNYLTDRPLYADLRESVRLHLGERYVGLRVNAHPPASVLMVLPLGRLDYPTAYRIWTFFWLLTLPITVAFILRQRQLGYSPWALLPIGTILLVSAPLEEDVLQGQFNLFLLAMLAGAWIAERRGRSALSGGLIGAATAIKLFPGFLVLFFVAQRRWRAVLAAGLGFAALNALAVAVFGWESFVTFVRDVIPQSRINDESWRNFSVRGYWVKLFDPQRFAIPLYRSTALALAGWLVSAAAIVGLTGWRAFQARDRSSRDLAFALCVLAMLLVAPVVWQHYLLLLTLPLLVIWPVTSGLRRGALLAVILILTLPRPSLLWDATAPLLGDFAVMPGTGKKAALPIHTLTVISYQLYSVLALFVLTLTLQVRPGPEPSRAAPQTGAR